nr:alcohol dehydrogenase catalytic domain-containing protein [Dyadobacter sp. NIV53]
MAFSKVPIPVPQENQILVKVIACGICRTDLHIVDGELADPKPDLIPGHEIVGQVVQSGSEVSRHKLAILSAFPGSDIPADTANIVSEIRRIFAKTPFLQAIRWTAGTLSYGSL